MADGAASAVVTPLAGVWIEMHRFTSKIQKILGSLPLRECGLKCQKHGSEKLSPQVTPLAGVWIEIEYWREP